MLLKDFIQRSVEALGKVYPAEEARSIVQRLCAERLGVESYTHILEPETEVPQAMLPALSSDMERLLAMEPLQYVLGWTEFCGHRFRVANGVLIPRPETEALVSHVLELWHGRTDLRVLDLCTGSGCIAWSLALGLTGARVTGVDISERALDIARAQEFPPSECIRPEFVLGDVLDPRSGFAEGRYDIIICNPPYVMRSEASAMRHNVLDYEPEGAIFAPADDALAFYRAVDALSGRYLSTDGQVFLEINALLWEENVDILRSSGRREIKIIPALDGSKRFISYKI